MFTNNTVLPHASKSIIPLVQQRKLRSIATCGANQGASYTLMDRCKGLSEVSGDPMMPKDSLLALYSLFFHFYSPLIFCYFIGKIPNPAQTNCSLGEISSANLTSIGTMQATQF